jgi:hypothetical protein
MFKFILQMLMVVSFGALLYIVARVLPRVGEREDNDREPSRTPRIVVYLEQADEKLLIVLEKLLRRIRVMLLKLDNTISKKLGRFSRPGNADGGSLSGDGKKTDEEI